VAKDDKKADKAKGDKAKGDKAKSAKDSKKKAKGRSTGSEAISVAAHPRGAAQVRRAKGCGGIGGFAIAAYLSYTAHVPPEIMGLRALVAGIAGYMLAWACSVTVWRYVVLAEIRALMESGRLTTEEPPTAAAPAADAMAEAVSEDGD